MGKHSRPTPHLAHVIFYLCLPCDLFSILIMDEAEVVRIVESTVTKKNENLLASKSLLDDSLNKLKRLHVDTADSHLKQIKKLKFDEPRFKKRGNEDQ